MIIISRTRNLLTALLIFACSSYSMAQTDLSEYSIKKLDCYSSLEEFFGDEFENWNINQFQENNLYSGAHYSDGPSINAPALYFHRNKDDKQCLILSVPFSDAMQFKFTADGTLIEVSAGEILPNGIIYNTLASEIIFKPTPEGYFVPSECKLHYFVTGKSKSYPCDVAQSMNFIPDGPDLILFPPSFDCARAYSKPEELICSSAKLAILDVALSKNYKSIKSIIGDKRDQLEHDQKTWLKQRNTCTTHQCLNESYRTRLDELCQKYVKTIDDSFFCITSDVLQF
jgi:hypothetical protein